MINWPLFTPVLIALLLGAALGLERSLAHKTAGMRTYGLVSMSSCLFIIISRLVIPAVQSYSFDPMRIAAGIIMGIGFMCGAVVVYQNHHLSGLTTAAGIWVATGIGMAVGYGFTNLAVFVTLITLVVFTLFWFIEQQVEKVVDGHGH